MGDNRAGTDLVTGICIIVLWYSAGISWWWFVMLFALGLIVNNIEFILRANRAYYKILTNIRTDLSKEMETARKREMARVRRSIHRSDDDDTRTVN